MYSFTYKNIFVHILKYRVGKLILGFWMGLGFSQIAEGQSVSFVKDSSVMVKNRRGDSASIVSLIEKSRETHKNDHDQKKEYELAQEAVDLALEYNDTLLYSRALDNLGLLYRYHQWYNQALPLHIKAYDFIKDKKEPPLYKMIFANNAGLAARYNEQYDVSVFYYLKALKIATEEQDLKNIGISSNGLGNALSNIPGRGKEALEYFEKGLAAEREQNDSLGMAMDILSISDYYIKNERYEQAVAYLDQLKEINEKRNDQFGIAITNEFYGHSYLSQGKLDQADHYYQKALNIYDKI